MAKKIVRGITDVKTINNQDFDTNNVNDLLSDGQYNYIHRKKGKNEEYHNLTDNIKTISSDNTELLAVTNNNKTTNTATLHPKHDTQKEQVLESTRDTITINHGENGTAEKTTVDTNPQKVLEHENLISNSQYVTIEHEQDSNTSEIKTDKLVTKLDELNNKIPTAIGGTNLLLYSADPMKAPSGYYQSSGAVRTEELLNGSVVCKTNIAWQSLNSNWGKHLIDRKNVKVGDEFTYSIYAKTDQTSSMDVILYAWFLGQSGADQLSGAFALTNEWKKLSVTFKVTQKMVSDSSKITWVGFAQASNSEDGKFVYYACNKLERGNIATDWSPAPEDTQQQFNSLNSSLSQKQNKLTAGTGITIQGNTISASGATSTIETYSDPAWEYRAFKHVVQSGIDALVTFVFYCFHGTAEHVITGDLKVELEELIGSNTTVSNGAVSITNDGTSIKLMNSKSTESGTQQATFTFYDFTGGGGGGDLPPAS